MRRPIAALALAGLLLTACGDDPGRAATSTTPGSVPADEPADGAAPEALRFSAPVVGGGQLDMSSFAGQTVAFWFWAPT